MHKLRWKTYDNPCGWIEPTTYCQLSCPGCYRGLDKNPKRMHQNLFGITQEIDKLISLRKIKLLTISGGEPLLYPYLSQVIKYAKLKKLKVRILTNGLALTREKLNELEGLGVDEILIHVSEYKVFPNYSRLGFIEMFKGSKILLGFCLTVTEKNLVEIPYLLKFFKNNYDSVSRVVLSPKWNLKKGWGDYQLFEKVWKMVEAAYQIKPSFYLGKTKSDKKAWLFFNYRKWSFKALKTYWRQIKFFSTRLPIPIGQMIAIAKLPDKTKNGWDLCDGCPDAMIYQGKLVPSCLLERIKKGEKIWIGS